MGTRPLRQYYTSPERTLVEVDIAPELRGIVAPWTEHRNRLLQLVGDLPADGWAAPTRCVDWDVREVIGHLAVVDQWWTLTLTNALTADADLTTYLTGFDPSSSTDDLTAAAVADGIAPLVESFATGTAALAGVVGRFDDAHWDHRTESPLGHLPALLCLGHAYWDTWLHERDILVPIGAAPEHSPAEVLAVTWFMLAFAGLQGGLLDDPASVASGPTAPIDATLAFTELPDHPLRLRVDQGVHLSIGDASAAEPAGSAIAFVDAAAGRGPRADLAALPPTVRAQVERATAVF